MGLILSYMFQSAIVMTCLYLCYKRFVASNTFHAVNRIALLAIYAISLTMPAFIPMFTYGEASGVTGFNIDQIVAVPVNAEAEAADARIWFYRILLWTYIAGVSAMLVRCILGLMRMLCIISRGKASQRDGYTLIVSSEASGPFSWMNYVVVRPDDCDDDLDLVINHELAHVGLRHSIDLILSQLTLTLQWFSPAAWLMDRELRNVHEYQVDNRVCSTSPYRYRMMLVKKTVGPSFPTFADSLNHSQLKNRLTMMISKKSRPAQRVAYLTLPAAAVVAFVALCFPVVASVTDTLRQATVSTGHLDASASPASTAEAADALPSDSKAPACFLNDKLYKGAISDINPTDIASMTVIKDDPAYPDGKVMIYTKDNNTTEGNTTVAATAEKLAEYKGGTSALMKALAQSLSFPKDAPANMTDVRVVVQFTVNTDGTLSDAKILRGSDFAPFNEQALKAVESTSGNWIPAYDNGQPIATSYVIPVQFKAE